MPIHNFFSKIFREQSHETRDTLWDLDEIRAMPTKEIIKKLRSFNIPFDKDTFLEDVKRFHSAENLSESWWEKHKCTATGYDEDFPWMAAWILWERLAPDRANMEMIDDLIQEGYDALEERNTTRACDIWLRTWECIKEMLTEDMTKVEQFDTIFRGTQYVYNWCQDFEMELGNAGVDDQKYFGKQIEYCREFYTQFTDEDELVLGNMRRAEADAYFFLGESKKGEEKYRELIEQYPNNVWGYIGWADQCCGFYGPNDRVDRDFGKAEELYLKALEIPEKRERDAVFERLIDFYEEMGNSEKADHYTKKLEELEMQHEFDVDSFDNSFPKGKEKKIGRNEPCPCGSGKKYKKCCGR